MFDHNPWNSLAVIHAVKMFDDRRDGSARLIDGVRVRPARRGIVSRLMGWIASDNHSLHAAAPAVADRATRVQAEQPTPRRHHSRPKLVATPDAKAFGERSDASRAA